MRRSLRLRCSGSALCALLLALPMAAQSSDLASRVNGLDSADVSAAQFEALQAELVATGDLNLQARAFARRCATILGQDPEGAGALAERGIPLAEQAGADAALGGLLVCRGYRAERSDQLDAAFAAYDAAVAASTRAGDSAGIGQAQVLRGEIQYLRGNVADALSDLLAAHQRYVDLDNPSKQTYALTAIANVYADKRVGQYAAALDYYQQALAANLARDKQQNAATDYFNIASTLQRLGRHAEAEAHFKQAITRYTALEDALSVAETLRGLASLYIEMAQFDAALAHADQAINHATASAEPELEASARLTRGIALRRLGRLEAAAGELERAQAYFSAQDNPRYLERIAGERAELEAARGRWQAAYEQRSAQLSLSERLTKANNDDLSSRLRVQFDSEQKEQQNAALRRENALREAALLTAERIRALQTLVIALGAVLLLGLIWLVLRTIRRARAMRNLALTDELTKLPNRRAIMQRVETRLRGRQPLAAPLLMFDIDHFKKINDSLGHDVGDEVLRRVANEARRALAGQGDIGRIGGEEFLILLRAADGDYMPTVAERLRLAIEALRFEGAASDLRVSISLGGAVSQPGEAVDALLKRADLALYRAKQGGRNRAEFD